MKTLLSLVLLFSTMTIGVIQAFETVDSKFYDLCEQVYNKAGLENFSYTRPYSRSQIIAAIREMLGKADQLSAVENELLFYYKEKYPSETYPNISSGIETVAIPSPYHLVEYSHENGTLTLDLVGKLGMYGNDFDRNNNRFNDLTVYTSGVTFRGRLGEKIDYYCYFVDETINGLDPFYGTSRTLDYTDENGMPKTETIRAVDRFTENGGFGWANYNQSRNEMYFDKARAWMQYSFSFGSVAIGKDENAWGPGVQSNVMLSDNAAPYVQFKTQFTVGKLRLTSLTAQLHSDELDPNTLIESDNGDVKYEYRKKYLATHRLEISFSSSFILGLSESVIYADKPFQIGYAIPFNVFWSEQHSQGDRDNMSFGLDLALKPMNRLSLYGELFFDDLSLRDLNNFHRTKAAYIAGLKWYPEFLQSGCMTVEYSRVNPFVYTHRYNVDNFTHSMSNLGSFLYPNSDYLFAEIKTDLTSRFGASLFCSLTRHGENYIDTDTAYHNVGGDIYHPDRLDIVSKTKDTMAFLDGIKTTEYSAGIKLSYRVDLRQIWGSLGIYDMYIDAGCAITNTQTEFPSDCSVLVIPDMSATQLYLAVRYNYDR